mmetsp:Transcript_15598/g.10966  ORF Transcript_15598/g.10966 Transcript_15598/m.10966 type:complete len:92 (+) Transcript_15598:30-305(+)|eukprot:CAMPEP_0116874416 /NCGR_PEP_ID=MMETSP0463-20121206/5866_1 /TAXON_ID=181622 /ORGANISM="Strombidinopsis sp, Strain SopsisLIS2011" /LENGTH=91 /DNA_ID=CAMNT_0004518015 /DNA_START=23 /DNA_END=298 /DNA_ORIENTATION=-
MEDNPYSFDAKNPRLVLNAERSQNVYYGAAALFFCSLHLYNRKFFRVDGNFINMLMFTGASVPASYGYANFFLGSEFTEAAIMNNEKERQA